MEKGNRLVVVLAAVFAVSWLVTYGREDAGSVARQKARYYYSAAIVEQANGNDAEAYEYFKKSWQADSTYAEAASAYGMMRLGIPMEALQSDEELERSLGMLRRYVDKYPDDIYESQYYSFVASQLDHTEDAVEVLEKLYEMYPQRSILLVQLEEIYSTSGDIKKAIESIDRYERQEGMSPQMTTRKLSLMFAEGDTVGAIREAGRLIMSDPSNPSYRILKGNVFEIINQPDSAFKYYSAAEHLDPESGAAKLALSEYYREKGDSVAYDNKIYELLLTEDFDLEQKTDLLAQYLQTLLTDKHDTSRGDHLFAVLHNQYPHEPRLLDLAARYSAAKQDFKDAEEQISYAIDRDPTNNIYWGQLMTYQAADGRFEESLETYERAKAHITPDPALKQYYTSVALMSKHYDLAAAMYREMIDSVNPGLQPDSVLTLTDIRRDITLDELQLLSRLISSLGDVYHEAGDNRKAYRMYENAISIDDTNSMAYNNYAYFLCLDNGDLEKALKLSEKSLSGADAENPTYLDTYAWISYLSGNYEKAEEVQRHALKAMEKETYQSAELYDHLGDILMKTGKPDEAVDAWKKAVEIQQQDENTDNDEYRKTVEKIKEHETK